jgi:hypothetical protein
MMKNFISGCISIVYVQGQVCCYWNQCTSTFPLPPTMVMKCRQNKSLVIFGCVSSSDICDIEWDGFVWLVWNSFPLFCIPICLWSYLHYSASFHLKYEYYFMKSRVVVELLNGFGIHNETMCQQCVCVCVFLRCVWHLHVIDMTCNVISSCET